MIRERVCAGLGAGQAEGITLGRPRIDAAVRGTQGASEGDKGMRKIPVECGGPYFRPDFRQPPPAGAHVLTRPHISHSMSL
jgi:hypothetical protein